MTLATRHWDRLGNGGLTFTELGFGSAPIGNLFRAISEAEAQATLATAWEGGVRYFDTAPLYGLGLAETRLNHFLRDKPRDSFVISTKIGRLLQVTSPDRRDGRDKWFDVPARNERFDYSYDGAWRSLEFSLERLGLDRVDIVYAHDLDVFTHGTTAARDGRLVEFLSGGYRALVEMRDQGIIRAFGAGVNEAEACQWLAQRGDIDLFLLAGRYTLLEQDPLDSLLPLCTARGIGIVVGGPYNSGILATGAVHGAMYNYAPAPQAVLDRVAALEAACTTFGVRLVDAAFRFPLLHPAVVSVIPGAQTQTQMQQTLKAARARIPHEVWSVMKKQGLIHVDAPISPVDTGVVNAR